MKKTYINPKMDIIKIQIQQILAGSTTMTVDASEENGVNDEDAVLSRQNFNLWDED